MADAQVTVHVVLVPAGYLNAMRRDIQLMRHELAIIKRQGWNLMSDQNDLDAALATEGAAVDALAADVAQDDADERGTLAYLQQKNPTVGLTPQESAEFNRLSAKFADMDATVKADDTLAVGDGAPAVPVAPVETTADSSDGSQGADAPVETDGSASATSGV